MRVNPSDSPASSFLPIWMISLHLDSELAWWIAADTSFLEILEFLGRDEQFGNLYTSICQQQGGFKQQHTSEGSHDLVPGDIDKVIKDQTDFAYNRKITMQPYVIIEGDTLSKIRTAYLVMNTMKYQFLTLWEAFDTLSQVYHVLHSKYPPKSEHLYTIIQRGVYKIETSFENITPQGHEILSLL
ncbi:hypothetical protein JTB14_003598 [Gonioctena quinquepunctata]|nr:hypothetical protein JTB14_003598 [Gonioctena quinquepunctata]